MAGLRAAHNLMIVNNNNSSQYTLVLSPIALYNKIYREVTSPPILYGEPRWDEKDYVLFEIYVELLYESNLEQDIESSYSLTFNDINNVTHILSEGSIPQQKNQKMFSPVLLGSFVARNYSNDYFEVDTISQQNIVTKDLKMDIRDPQGQILIKKIKTTVKGTYLGTKNGSIFSYNP